MDLDLTKQDLSEDQLLVELRRAFDSNEFPEGVTINSRTAINLQGSPNLHFEGLEDDALCLYRCVLGTCYIIPLSQADINQGELPF